MRLVPSKGYMYLASPYSHPDPFVREYRYLRAMQAMSRLLKEGIHVYAPIVHCHELAKVVDMPRTADFWRDYNFTMLRCAESLGVLMMDGWKESKGMAEEIEEATSCNILINYLEEDNGKETIRVAGS